MVMKYPFRCQSQIRSLGVSELCAIGDSSAFVAHLDNTREAVVNQCIEEMRARMAPLGLGSRKLSWRVYTACGHMPPTLRPNFLAMTRPITRTRVSLTKSAGLSVMLVARPQARVSAG